MSGPIEWYVIVVPGGPTIGPYYTDTAAASTIMAAITTSPILNAAQAIAYRYRNGVWSMLVQGPPPPGQTGYE